LKTVVCGLFIACVAALTAFVLLASSYRSAALRVCDLVDENFYRHDEVATQNFVVWCRQSAQEQSFYISKKLNISRINARLSMIVSSHLTLFDPDENRQIWLNEGLDTGIRVRRVEEQIVVNKVIPKSPADLAGIIPGDSLLTINGETLAFERDAQSVRGLYKLRRAGKELEIEVGAAELTEDLRPSLDDLGRGRGYLRIPSFLGQYFEAEEWKKISFQLNNFRSLVIDLRDNSGGSFPAMLRALSPFRCDDPLIGKIHRSSASGAKYIETRMLDTLDVESQIRQLDESQNLGLVTFDSYGCFNGRIIVLVDAGTMSVSEIFAHAFFARSNSFVWGQPSAGQVVLARWFQVPEFGSDTYQISIPIGGYEAADGTDLEQKGVQPTKFIWYDLKSSLEGRDSWLESAARAL
jgi:C-terminal processing protease CtpA/Prc